ncbi:MAG TPA: type II toxin-antitoxin system VapC family toxin [Herpetosiphonaceae bacterium]|nr:type II toxin-antitoxin system VapC family toxin [Herpetosiphonaceae bacterium]
MIYLLDTNICIYLIKQKPPHILAKFNRHTLDDLGISAISVAELQYGVQKSRFPAQNQAALEQFLLPLNIVDFDYAAAIAYGRIRAHLEGHGTPIGAMDMLIAAQALSANLTIITNNTREFNRIPSLRMLNWLEE